MKYFTLLLILLIVACTNAPEKTYRTWKGESITKSAIDSLKNSGYIIHYLDSTVTTDSKKYTVYFYHESAQHADLKKRHEGRQLPDFSLRDLNGRLITTNSQSGKPTMISCWSVVCKPCIQEMPILNQLKIEYDDQVNFIAIALEEQNRVAKILKKHSFDFLQLVNGENYLNEIGVRAFPTTFLVSAEGQILEVIEGTPVPVSEDPSEASNWQTELLETYSGMIRENFAH